MVPFVVALVSIAQSEAAPAPARPSFLRLNVDPALGRGHRQLEVGILPPEGSLLRERSRPDYWFRRTSPRDTSLPPAYTTTRDCPAARAALKSLEQLAMPAPDIPGIGHHVGVIVLDGVGYSLEAGTIHADGQSGQARLTGNVGSPLARWAQAMEAALAPCWQPQGSVGQVKAP